MIIARCPVCLGNFKTKPYRLKRSRRVTCSWECNRKERRSHDVPPDPKFCQDCKKWKALSEFYKTPSRRDGHQRLCRDCFLERYVTGNEARLEYGRRYQAGVRARRKLNGL